MAVNQPNFELSNSYHFLFRIIQVLKIKRNTDEMYRFTFKNNSLQHQEERGEANGPTATKTELQSCFMNTAEREGRNFMELILSTGVPDTATRRNYCYSY